MPLISIVSPFRIISNRIASHLGHAAVMGAIDVIVRAWRPAVPDSGEQFLRSLSAPDLFVRRDVMVSEVRSLS
jgi:hypothetical protein